MRILFYIGIVLAVAAGVYFKMGVIEERRSAPTVSILKEWEKDGKPIEIASAEKGEMVILERTTAKVESPTRAIAQISRSLLSQFNSAKEVYLLLGSDETRAGRVVSVSGSPNAKTGLYVVVVQPTVPFAKEHVGDSVVLDVAVSKISDVLRVPVSSVKPTPEGQVVWRLKGDTVERVSVKVGRVTSQHVEIVSGLSPGDEVVVRGQSLLAEGENVQVVSTNLKAGGAE